MASYLLHISGLRCSASTSRDWLKVIADTVNSCPARGPLLIVGGIFAGAPSIEAIRNYMYFVTLIKKPILVEPQPGEYTPIVDSVIYKPRGLHHGINFCGVDEPATTSTQVGQPTVYIGFSHALATSDTPGVWALGGRPDYLKVYSNVVYSGAITYMYPGESVHKGMVVWDVSARMAWWIAIQQATPESQAGPDSAQPGELYRFTTVQRCLYTVMEPTMRPLLAALVPTYVPPWKPRALLVKDFMCYRNLYIDFTQLTGPCGVIAGNGCGKTTIVDALLFAAYGIADRAWKQNIVRRGAKQAKIALVIESDGAIYTIVRKDSASKNNSIKFLMIEGAKQIDLSAPTYDETYSRIRSITGDHMVAGRLFLAHRLGPPIIDMSARKLFEFIAQIFTCTHYAHKWHFPSEIPDGATPQPATVPTAPKPRGRPRSKTASKTAGNSAGNFARKTAGKPGGYKRKTPTGSRGKPRDTQRSVSDMGAIKTSYKQLSTALRAATQFIFESVIGEILERVNKVLSGFPEVGYSGEFTIGGVPATAGSAFQREALDTALRLVIAGLAGYECIFIDAEFGAADAVGISVFERMFTRMAAGFKFIFITTHRIEVQNILHGINRIKTGFGTHGQFSELHIPETMPQQLQPQQARPPKNYTVCPCGALVHHQRVRTHQRTRRHAAGIKQSAQSQLERLNA